MESFEPVIRSYNGSMMSMQVRSGWTAKYRPSLLVFYYFDSLLSLYERYLESLPVFSLFYLPVTNAL